ncbi:MAG TPA: metallophosphoesterase family protein, partial [Spirochaetota bacterium]|nr:metallophosphoesterase family protein [Spirochaetota bacterium]
TLGGKQKSYLIDKLKKSKDKNKIIFSHYSLFDREVESPTAMTYPEERYELFDIFEKYQVTYFVSGHLHFYDYKEIKGTKYIILNNFEKKTNSYLKFYVKNGKISHIVF